VRLILVRILRGIRGVLGVMLSRRTNRSRRASLKAVRGVRRRGYRGPYALKLWDAPGCPSTLYDHCFPSNATRLTSSIHLVLEMMRRHLDSSVSELIATATHLKTHEESQTKAFAEVRRSANPSKLCGFCQELVNIDWVSASEESEERVETVHYSHHPTDEDLKMYQYSFLFLGYGDPEDISDFPVLQGLNQRMRFLHASSTKSTLAVLVPRAETSP
jgi:hypothetical protein